MGAFLRWCEEKPGAVAVPEAIVAIAAVHVRRGYGRPERHMIVRRTLAALARRRGAAPGRILKPASGATVLFRAGDFAAKPLKPRPQKAVPAGTTRTAPKLVARRQYRTAH